MQSETSVERDALQPKNGKTTAIKLVVWALIVIALALGAFFFTNHFVVRWPIEGSSMNPTLLDEDYVLLFQTTRVRRGNVIIFLHEPAGKHYVKRVIGVGGDTISSVYDEENLCYHVYCNGELVSEKYVSEPMRASAGWSEFTVEVPEDELFVLGDNRNHSYDSQDGYFVPTKDVKGIVFLRITEKVFKLVR